MLREWIHSVVWYQRHALRRLPVPELAIIRPFVQPDDALVDIGAHAGSWLVPMSGLVPRGQVFAFEALPYYANVLRKLMRLQLRSNVRIINHAVTEAPTTVRMVWQDPSGNRIAGFTHIASSRETMAGTVEVAGVPLDQDLADNRRRVRFIKCDVEGAELGVFRGGRGTIQKWRPLVYTELVQELLSRYGHSTGDVFGFFRELDYTAWDLGAESGPRAIPDAASYQGHDVLFVPKEENPSWRR